MNWSKPQISIITQRLVLRPFALSDSEATKTLANDWDVYDMTLNLPHPYSKKEAINWINTHQDQYSKQSNIVFAITLKDTNTLIGAINLAIRKTNSSAEFGYWIGKKYWNNGYCSEALKSILKLGFNQLKLNRIYASHIARNPASGKVMSKNRMIKEGLLKKQIKKGQVFEDLVMYGLLKEDFDS